MITKAIISELWFATGDSVLGVASIALLQTCIVWKGLAKSSLDKVGGLGIDK